MTDDACMRETIHYNACVSRILRLHLLKLLKIEKAALNLFD